MDCNFCLMLFACGLCACAADAEMSAENTSADAVMDEAAALAAESSSTGSSPLLDDRKLGEALPCPSKHWTLMPFVHHFCS